MKLKGKVHKYGANVDTDAIIPARYLNVSEPSDLAKHCMEDIDPDFVKKVQPGDIIVADHQLRLRLVAGARAPGHQGGAASRRVIAKSFARIFYRNAINIGLPILECPEAVDGTNAGDMLEIDLDAGEITNVTERRPSRPSPSRRSCWS